MKKIFLVLIVMLLTSPAWAQWSSMKSAAGNVVANSSTQASSAGNPEETRIPQTPAVSLGRFDRLVKLYPVVEIVGGDAKVRSRLESELKAKLMSLAPRCGYLVANTAGKDTVSFKLTVVVDHGQQTSNSRNSSSESWSSGSYRRGYSNSSSSSNSSYTGGEDLFFASQVATEIVAGNVVIASISDVFSADRQRTASRIGDSSNRSWSYGSYRWGSSSNSSSSSYESSSRTDSDYAKSMASRVTVKESVEKAVLITLASAIDYHNYLLRQNMLP